MNKKLLARSVSERMFARQCGIIEKLLAHSSASLRIVERALSELCTKWSTLQERHDAYACEFVGDDSVEVTANEALIDNYSSEFVRLELACDEFHKLHSKETPATPASTATSTQNSIKLERLRFRTFDGDLRKYPKFKSEFVMYVQPLCDPNQLPFVLKSYLCDSVRRLVEHIDHDISAMWNRLDERYGTVRKQIDCILSAFKNLPPCIDTPSTLNMISIVEFAEADLKCMNAESQLENALIISILKTVCLRK
jgi:hypothetical protein